VAITSLIVKIGAQDEGIQKALDKLGKQATTVEGELARLGQTPVGREVIKSLEQIEAATKKVQEGHQRMADRALNAARGMELVGGASKLTTSELTELNRVALKGVDAFSAMGKEAPPALQKMVTETTKLTAAGKGFNSFLGDANKLLGAFGVSLSIGAVVGFGKSLLNMGDEIQRVSDRTGLTTKEVQELSYVASQSGNSIDEMTGAIGQLQNRLASGDKSAVGAVKALGINLEALKSASPADQLQMIATEAAKIKDPMDLTAASMDLFGKSGAIILPTLVSNFAKLRAEAPKMSDATVKALDQAGDQLGRFGLQIKIWAAESYNFAGQGFDYLTKAAFNAIAKMRELTVAVLKIVENIPGASKAFNMLGINIDKLSENAQWYRDAAKSMEARTEAVGKAATAAAPKLKLFNAETEKAAKDADKAKEKFDSLTEKVHALEAGLFAVPDALKSIGRSYDDSKLALYKEKFEQLTAAVAKVEESAHIANFGFKGMTDELKNVGIAGEDVVRTAKDIEASFQFTGPVQQEVQTLGQSLKGVLKGVPGMIAAAFTGGGGILGALKGIGSQIGSTLGERIGKALGMTGPIGAAIGSLAGPLIGAFSKLFSSVEKQVNPVREQFVQMAGGLDALNRKAAAAGVTLKAMLDAKTPEAYKKAVDDLNAAFQFQEDALALAMETAKRYGFTIEELGPALQRQELDKQAQQIFKDWTILNAAGIETTAITARMAQSVNDYVKQAVKMGVEVPSAMKPMLQAMIDQGLLTDAAGNKIENLEDSGITFAQTMSEGFKSVVDEVKKLAEAITRSLGGAIQGLPTHKQISVGFDVEPINLPGASRERNFAAHGGLVTDRGMQRFASGGRVLPFRGRGRDTQIIAAQAGEIILNEAMQGNVAAAIVGGGGDSDDGAADLVRYLRGREATESARLQALIRATVQTSKRAG